MRRLLMAIALVLVGGMAVAGWTPWAAWAFAGGEETLIVLTSAPAGADICVQQAGGMMACRTIGELRQWLVPACESTTGCAPDPRGGDTIEYAHTARRR